MAKRSNFQGGGIPGGYQNMLKQAQRMQAQLQQKQAEIEAKEFNAQAGGGAVKVTITGTRNITSVEIAKEAVDPDDVETLQDLVMAAVNEALKQVDDAYGELTQGLGNLGGLM